MLKGAEGVKLVDVLLERVEEVTLPEVEGTGKEGDEDKVLPSHTKMYDAKSNKNESLENFGTILL